MEAFSVKKGGLKCLPGGDSREGRRVNELPRMIKKEKVRVVRDARFAEDFGERKGKGRKKHLLLIALGGKGKGSAEVFFFHRMGGRMNGKLKEGKQCERKAWGRGQWCHEKNQTPYKNTKEFVLEAARRRGGLLGRGFSMGLLVKE